jgi:F-type H+-transporting ATPase subunit a
MRVTTHPREREYAPDWWLFLVTLLLLSGGVVMVFNASFAFATEVHGDPWYFVRKQALWAVVGVAGMFAAMRIPYWKLAKFAFPALIAVIGLLTAVLVIGHGALGAQRWIGVGPIKIQPSEFAKLAVVLFLARVIADRPARMRHLWTGVLPILAIVLFVILLVELQPDLGTAITILLGIVLMRARIGVRPDNRQTLGEWVYQIAQVNIAEQGLPSKAIGRWFPYVATLLIFIAMLNFISFIPLPLSDETVEIAGVELPTLGIYAATSSIAVTLALALMTFVFTHVEGIRANGVVGYFKSWIPDVPKAMYPLIVPLEVLSQFMRLVSLSVRLYANMLAGHMLILTFIGLMFVLESVALAVFSIPLATAFYLFEVIIVVWIQAFIFATLSAIYIGSAIEPEH